MTHVSCWDFRGYTKPPKLFVKFEVWVYFSDKMVAYFLSDFQKAGILSSHRFWELSWYGGKIRAEIRFGGSSPSDTVRPWGELHPQLLAWTSRPLHSWFCLGQFDWEFFGHWNLIKSVKSIISTTACLPNIYTVPSAVEGCVGAQKVEMLQRFP